MALSEPVLDELAELAAVEHALVAEYLQVAYVLGHGLPEPAPGPAGAAVADAAQKMLDLAQFVEMKHLKLVNELLVASGRPAQLGQAVGLDHGLGSGAMTVFGPLGDGELAGLAQRETALAAAVDDRYARLPPEVDPEFGLGPSLADVVARCDHHAANLAGFTELLTPLDPADYVRVPRHDPADGLEKDLVDAGRSYYGLVLALLAASLDHPAEEHSSTLLSDAIGVMGDLDRHNALLVARGLLPTLAPPAGRSGS